MIILLYVGSGTLSMEESVRRSFAALLPHRHLDPLPMPDEVEDEPDHHEIAAVGVEVRDIKRRRRSKVLWMVKNS